MTDTLPVMSATAALEIIKAALKQHGTAIPEPSPKYLDRNQMARMAALFTTRTLEYRIVDQEVHVRDLADAIGNPKKPHYLDPITVWWGGDRYYVIDGHLRLQAYARKGVNERIPVVTFEGSLDEAMAQSAALNSKNQLPMTKDDRLNCAWRLTLVSSLTKEKIVQACAVANGSVGNMRVVKKTLMEETGRPLQYLCDLTWDDARREAEGLEIKEETDMDAETRKRAQRYARAITRAVGDRPHQDPDAFAMALDMMGLPKRLMTSYEWETPLKEVIRELQETLGVSDLSNYWDEQEQMAAEKQAAWDSDPDY